MCVKHGNFFIGLLLAGITLALYWPVHGFGLVYYDDPLFLTDSPIIQSGLNWHSFLGAFSSVVLANWHPVTTLSFVIDLEWFGTNPGAEHVVNALLHAANAVLLFLLLNGLTGATWRSALVAAVFAWHPLRVESVAWITERKDVLSGFFFILTLLFYGQRFKTRETGSVIWFWASLGAFVLGLMSKAMLVTVPLVLCLLDVWPLQRLGRAGAIGSGPAAPPPTRKQTWKILKQLVWEKWPFLAVSAVFSVLTYVIQKQDAAVVSLAKLGWNYRLANALTSYLRYLAKLVWPTDLAVVYPYQRIDDWLQTGVIALVLVAISALCLWQFRRRPWLAVGWFWYLGTAVPIIGLVQVGEACMADRYTYLPLIGPVIALGWLIPDAWACSSFSRALYGVAAAAGLWALVVLTHIQIQYWHDTVSLFSHAIAVTDANPGAESGLGYGLEHEGRLAEALEHHRTALRLNPEDREYHLKVGEILRQQGQWGEAADTISFLLTTDPNDLAAHEDLGSILPHLGRYEEARQHLEAAVKIAPDDPGLLNNLAWLLATCPEATVRNGGRAVQLAERACTLTHFQKTVMMGTLAAAYAEAGRFEDATATAQKACANASALGETELLQRNQELLATYQKHQPRHEGDK